MHHLTNDFLYFAVKLDIAFLNNDDKLFHCSGTGFFAKNKEGKVCLVTNRHVLDYSYNQQDDSSIGAKYKLNSITVSYKIHDETYIPA